MLFNFLMNKLINNEDDPADKLTEGVNDFLYTGGKLFPAVGANLVENVVRKRGLFGDKEEDEEVNNFR